MGGLSNNRGERSNEREKRESDFIRTEEWGARPRSNSGIN